MRIKFRPLLAGITQSQGVDPVFHQNSRNVKNIGLDISNPQGTGSAVPQILYSRDRLCRPAFGAGLPKLVDEISGVG
jgi:hypothetical protein